MEAEKVVAVAGLAVVGPVVAVQVEASVVATAMGLVVVQAEASAVVAAAKAMGSVVAQALVLAAAKGVGSAVAQALVLVASESVQLKEQLSVQELGRRKGHSRVGKLVQKLAYYWA